MLFKSAALLAAKNSLSYATVVIPLWLAGIEVSEDMQSALFWGGVGGGIRWLAARSRPLAGLAYVVGGIAVAAALDGFHAAEFLHIRHYFDPEDLPRSNRVILGFIGAGGFGYAWDFIAALRKRSAP